VLVIFAGLPGTGKSTVAQAVAREIDAVVLDKDRLRAALFPADRIEYSTEQDDFVMRLLLEAASHLLTRGEIVFVDGRVFSRRYQIEMCQAITEEWSVIECVCPADVAKARLEDDVATGRHPAANRTPALYDELRSRMEEITEPKLVIDTTRPLAENVVEVRRYLGA
jgi:predicted kinase